MIFQKESVLLKSMNIESVRNIIENEIVNNDKHHFIIVATAGICVSGNLDPIEEINTLITEIKKNYYGVEFYFHVDASFAGLTVPFLTQSVKIGFENSNVKSVTIDGDKMGLLPYPSGVFLCRKGLQKYITRDVHYIRGGHDDTISGSRSGVGSMSAWYMIHKYGFDGYKKLAEDCISHRDKLKNMLMERNLKGIRILDHSPYVNFLPLVIDIEDGKIPDKLIEEEPLKHYHMRSDILTIGGKQVYVYKICIMRHTFEHLEKFVNTLEYVVNNHKN